MESKVRLHPHIHCVVPAGGLSLDHTRWVRSPDNYFLPKGVLRKVFRGKFVAALRQAFRNGELRFPEKFKLLAYPKIFAAWLRPLYRKPWVVYLKPPFGGPEYVLQYLGRYTHRVAISNHRLVSFADGQVTFRWRDSAHHNEQKLTAVSHDKFLRRFLLHILPQGFVRIRHFGLLACRRLNLNHRVTPRLHKVRFQYLSGDRVNYGDRWRGPSLTSFGHYFRSASGIYVFGGKYVRCLHQHRNSSMRSKVGQHPLIRCQTVASK